MKQIILLAFIFLSCTPNKNESASIVDSVVTENIEQETISPVDELHDSDYGIYHFTFNINRNFPYYSLKFHTPDEKFYLYSNPTEEGSPMQEFKFSEDINYEEGYFAGNPEASFSLLDYNFDGYKDLSIIRISAISNVWYDIFLFDPSSKKFVKEETLSEFAAPAIDSVNQLVRFHNGGGNAGGWYTAGIIQWQNQKPVIVREEEQTSFDDNPEIFIRTIRVRQQNGELVLASKVQLQQVENNKEKQCLLEGEWAEFDKYHQPLFAESKEAVIKVDGRTGSCN